MGCMGLHGVRMRWGRPQDVQGHLAYLIIQAWVRVGAWGSHGDTWMHTAYSGDPSCPPCLPPPLFLSPSRS